MGFLSYVLCRLKANEEKHQNSDLIYQIPLGIAQAIPQQRVAMGENEYRILTHHAQFGALGLHSRCTDLGKSLEAIPPH